MPHFFKARHTYEVELWLQSHKHGVIGDVLIFLDDTDAMRFKLKFAEHIKEELNGGDDYQTARRRLIDFAGLKTDRSR